MKIREGFVSNSSSTSFTLALPNKAMALGLTARTVFETRFSKCLQHCGTVENLLDSLTGEHDALARGVAAARADLEVLRDKSITTKVAQVLEAVRSHHEGEQEKKFLQGQGKKTRWSHPRTIHLYYDGDSKRSPLELLGDVTSGLERDIEEAERRLATLQEQIKRLQDLRSKRRAGWEVIELEVDHLHDGDIERIIKETGAVTIHTYST